MSWRNRGGGFSPTYGRDAFDERAFRRASLPGWDALWQNLTVAARASFLEEVKIPPRGNLHVVNPPPSAEIRLFPPAVLEELTRAGFVELRTGLGFPPPGRVFATAGVHDFAVRVRTLKRLRLLDPAQTSAVKTYVENNYIQHSLIDVVMGVLSRVGIREYLRLSDALDRYILTHRWVGWVAAALGDPLAEPIVEQAVQASGPIGLAELVLKVNSADPAAVRASLDRLVAHLALFEDLDPETHELRVGFLPSIRGPLFESRRPRQRQPLVVCETLREVGPDEGFVISDVRALLLELASAPARIKLDRSLFQKEVERFEGSLESLPGWVSEPLKSTRTARLFYTLRMAKGLELVQEAQSEKAWYLRLSSRGEQWLIASGDDQFLKVVAAFRTPAKAGEPYTSGAYAFRAAYDPLGYASRNDSLFLGAEVTILPVNNRGLVPGLWETETKNFEQLRRSLDGIFSALPMGVYHRIDHFVDHAIFGDHNPLLLGTGVNSGRVAVYCDGQPIPPLLDRLEDTARSLLHTFLGSRLIPLGCVRIGLHDQGGIALARTHRLDAYFGRPMASDHPAGGATPASKVVVQPDYSIVIIGPSAAPAAALLPFCERTSPGSGPGALVLKITRESVLQAIGRGLPPAEVLVRLKRHASHELPANVVREVEGWAGWVRSVAVERMTVIRCPDRATADRVMGALPRQAERVHETLVAIASSKLTSLERQKLLGQGIIVADDAPAEQSGPKPRPKTKPKTRRTRRWTE